jgi:outer membrane receptor protein involved in Fe transport
MEGLIANFSVTYADTRYGHNGVCFRVNRPDLSLNRCPGESNAVSGCEDDPPLGTPSAPCISFPRNQFADGHRMTQSPAWTGSFQLSLQRPLFSTGWFWYSGGNAYYRGRHKTSSDLDSLKGEDLHWKVNLQGGVRSPGEHLDLQLWVNNVTDEIVTTGNFDTVFQAGSFSAFKQTPRTYGVTAIYHFGE